MNLSNIITTSFYCETLEELLKELAREMTQINEKIYKVEIENGWGKTGWRCKIEHTK